MKLKRQKIKRKDPRFDVELTAMIRNTNSKIAQKSQVGTVSRGGMFLELESDLPELGEHLEFQLHLDNVDQFPVEGIAIIRWVQEEEDSEQPRGVGVEFTHVSEENTGRFLQFIATNASYF